MKKQTSNKKKNTTQKIIKNLDAAGFSDYLQYLHSPAKIFFTNFLAGISRGFGIIIGMSVIVALVVWLLSQFVNFPLIGEYSQKITNDINDYVESTNYKKNFENIEVLLEDIDKNLEKK